MMSKFLKITLSSLVVVVGVLLSLISAVTFGQQYQSVLSDYPSTGQVLNLSVINDDRLARNALDIARQIVKEKGGIIIRRDLVVSNIDGSSEGYRYGFDGNLADAPAGALLEFAGTQIFSKENLALLASANPKSTLGLDRVQADSIAYLPSVELSARPIGMQLSNLVDISHNVRGTYRVIGLTSADFTNLVQQISQATSIPSGKMTSALSGAAETGAVFLTLLFGFLAITVVMIAALLTVNVYQSVRQLGMFLLLGLTKCHFLAKNWRFGIGIGVGLMALVGGMLWVRRDFPITMQTFVHLAQYATLYIVLLAGACLPAIVAVYLAKPVNAIRNRVSQRGMVLVLAALFALTSGVCVIGLRAMDGPLGEITKVQTLKKSWHEVEDHQILHRDGVGSNQVDGQTGLSDTRQREYFAWYESIEDKPGVSLINTTFHDVATLDNWRNSQVYENVPKKPFWYFSASANYLRSVGFPVADRDRALALDGVRVYYLPDTLSKDESETMSDWLAEDARRHVDSAIATRFTKNPRYEFRTYTPDISFFTWNEESPNNIHTKDPVIYLATAANMTYFENESLSAPGLQGSYIKLEASAKEKYTAKSYLAKYQIDDNEPQFIPVSNFLAGLHKTFTRLLELFGTAVALGAVIDMMLIVGLVQLYAKANAKRVAVLRLMGYPLVHIFRAPFAVVLGATILATLAGIPLGSDSIIAFMPILGLIQLALVFVVASRAATTHVSHLLKAN
ncbi:hypothetical protein J2S49_000918 [Arcanobacterium wilhelmae]|uniref:Uncharacterized protein n=1 Tax=Arcanobacterium wilhelmae TaxID=1803177 RepID=A0ABT9NAU1_9ACTO|nr:hypothetical protein [Arcanobacterium wilhelmae]MDP9800842.1 hypothetical protein [Arcanobacterium wilhelmae]WFN90216.1 hypothetical protein P8A24_08530 [Arcanobacterium wilhelmae]